MATEPSSFGEDWGGARFFAGLVTGLVVAVGANYLWFRSGPDGDAFFKPTLVVAAVTAAGGLALQVTSEWRPFGLGCVAGAALSLPAILSAMWCLFLIVGS
ncbi:hypothetical protein [Nocardioides jejuensis]|uniref:Uncharacterized protein n=1 Tax=Nocardioides jejuensis TaxID=2502782 RepID=A0A4R1CHA0_9ACTN|nr:hypothetical protein [Nocardioides jejuensis]TCJ30783.1 hypothetical protein EPD65_01735 [Nocardioides jejuensis]